jgi:hypothetical protein
LNPLPPFIQGHAAFFSELLRHLPLAGFLENEDVLKVVVIEDAHGVRVASQEWSTEIARESLVPYEPLQQTETALLSDLKRIAPEGDSGDGRIVGVTILGDDVCNIECESSARDGNSEELVADFPKM